MTYLRTVLLIAALVAPSTGFAAEPKCKGESGLRSGNSRVKTKLTFTNKSGGTALMYWISFKGKRVLYQELKPNGSYTQETFLTHPWVATSSIGKCIGLFKPKRTPESVVLD